MDLKRISDNAVPRIAYAFFCGRFDAYWFNRRIPELLRKIRLTADSRSPYNNITGFPAHSRSLKQPLRQPGRISFIRRQG